MPCPDEGLLRAYVDRELPVRQMDDLSRHLAGCGGCRDRLAEIERTANLVRSRLATLAPTEAEQPVEPVLAMAALRRRTRVFRPWGERLRERLAGFGASLSPARVAAAAVPLALAAALALTPLRLAAEGFLSAFRVQQVQAVQVDASLLSSLPEPEDLGTLTMSAQPSLKTSTLVDAGKVAGLTPRTVKRLPAGLGSQSVVMVSDPLEGTFTYDVEKLKAYYRRRGIAGEPPAELGALTVKGAMPPAVVVVYGDEQVVAQLQGSSGGPKEARSHDSAALSTARFLALAQARSPHLEVPSGVDLQKLREQGLKSGLLPPEISAQIAAIQDWQNTLPVPVLKGTSKDVTVDGVHGVLVSGKHGEVWLIWQRDGIVYGLFGTVSEGDLLAAANSLQ